MEPPNKMSPHIPPQKTKSNGQALDMAAMSPDELIKHAQSLMVIAQQREAEQSKAVEAQKQRERQEKVRILEKMRKDLNRAERRLAFLRDAKPISADDILTLETDLENAIENVADLKGEIVLLTEQLGLVEAPPVALVGKSSTNWAGLSWAVVKILVLLAACSVIVLYSGEWILRKYPNAAIYNEVSFQKVLFGVSVFFTGIVTSIVAMSLFVPQLAKYMNPFINNEPDFFKDFKTSLPWQRSFFAILFFVAFFLAFVLIVSGKMD
jgi:hypothetical protein